MTNIFFIIIAILWLGCNSAQQNDTVSTKQPPSAKHDTTYTDTTILKVAFQQEDTAYNEYLAPILKPIRENFKRINSVSKWTSIDKKVLNESTEGGEAKFYYLSGTLEKVGTRNFGETFQQLTEYYLLKGQLSFVFEKSYKYNRPIYYDSTSMKENNDNQAFDFDKSKITEDRNYFDKGKLIHQVNNEDCGSPFANDYLLTEQKRIIADFDKLTRRKKSS